ncbi:MAG: uridine kinase [Saprospiraceae bacterium]|nr:uridine kinase [Saprospiraceae bacterium]
MLIGVTGGSGAGKTEFIKQLRTRFKESELALISADNYYLPRETLAKDERGVINFDLPETIDHIAFVEDLKLLKQNKTVRRKEYTFNNEKATAKEIVLSSATVYIVEGLFILHEEKVRELLDLIILIDADDVKKISRRIIRDQTERNYPLEDVLYRYNNHVAPAYQKFILPYLENIDIIINNNHHFGKALEVISAYIKNLVDNKSMLFN